LHEHSDHAKADGQQNEQPGKSCPLPAWMPATARLPGGGFVSDCGETHGGAARYWTSTDRSNERERSWRISPSQITTVWNAPSAPDSALEPLGNSRRKVPKRVAWSTVPETRAHFRGRRTAASAARVSACWRHSAYLSFGTSV
jgi:hypothetical protein